MTRHDAFRTFHCTPDWSADGSPDRHNGSLVWSESRSQSASGAFGGLALMKIAVRAVFELQNRWFVPTNPWISILQPVEWFNPVTWQKESSLDIKYRRTFLPSVIFLHPKTNFTLKNFETARIEFRPLFEWRKRVKEDFLRSEDFILKLNQHHKLQHQCGSRELLLTKK